jgi:hypothetical protein
LQRATTSTWHNVGDNGVDVDGLFRTPLPSGGGGGGCFVSGVFVFEGLFMWWCPLRRVLCQCFFLNDTAMLLLLFKKMMYILNKSFVMLSIVIILTMVDLHMFYSRFFPKEKC